MTTPAGQEADRPSVTKRYGPLVAVVVVLAVVAAGVTLAGRGDGGSDPSATASLPVTDGSGVTSDVPLTFEQAKAQGKEGSITWVDNCDPATGRIKMPSVFAPPCVPKPTGTNGGATYPGVSADTVTIVNYVPSANGDLQALLAGNMDKPEIASETTKKYAEMFNDLYETYGRKVEVVDYQSNGQPNDKIAAQSDAIAVSEQYHAFASLGGPALTPAYAEELATRGVLCVGCGLSLPDQFYQDHAPYIWGPNPTVEEFLMNLADFMTNKVVGGKAEFAGGEQKDKDRVFGVVHFEQDPPVFTEVNDRVAECGSALGWEAKDTETYLFDLGTMADRATSIIAKMKSEGVTTIVFLGDPIMPIYLTKQATAQNYFPEWIVTGTVLTDTTVLGRKYDPEQWQHAFGISNLPARQPRELGDPWRLHEWYYDQAPAAANTSALIYTAVSQVMLGIHMAGPNLTPTTFRDGMFNYPESGGGPTTPHISYGNHGYFSSPSKDDCKKVEPRTDYLGVDDVVEIWWDRNAEGPDEQGKSDAKGAWRYANNGRRYLPGQMSKDPLAAFKLDNTVVVMEQTPPQDTPPSYPSPTTGG